MAPPNSDPGVVGGEGAVPRISDGLDCAPLIMTAGTSPNGAFVAVVSGVAGGDKVLALGFGGSSFPTLYVLARPIRMRYTPIIHTIWLLCFVSCSNPNCIL